MRRAIVVRISGEVLLMWLGLSGAHRVRSIIHDGATETFRVLVEGPDLPVVEEYEVPQEALCHVARNARGCWEASIQEVGR